MKHFKILIVLIIPIAFCGCLSTITSITVPSEIIVGESFNIAIWGTVAGDQAGFAGVVLQVPNSFHYEQAIYNSKYARRMLKRNNDIEERYTNEDGYYIIALIDSASYLRETSGEVEVLVSLTPEQAGSFTVKAVSGGALRKPGLDSWRASDPKKIYSFVHVVDQKYFAACTVKEPQLTGTNALMFDGQHSYVSLPSKDILAIPLDSNFTIEFWMLTTASDVSLISKRADDILGQYPMELSIDEFGSLLLTASNGLKTFRSTNQFFIADGCWHHIALAHSNQRKECIIYIDGAKKDSIHIPSEHTSNDQCVIIGSRGGRRNFFRGVMDELRFWKREQTGMEIRFFQNIILSGFEEGLYALYSFDKTSGGYIQNGTPENDIDATAFNYPKLVPSSAPLKVEFTTFKSELEEDSLTISWETFDEKEIKRFEVEKRYESGKYSTFDTFDAQKSPSNHNRYSIRDKRNNNVVTYYRLRQINEDGSIHISGELSIGLEEVHNFTLEQNIPNPFQSTTVIKYTLREEAHVILTVYDLFGREVMKLVDQKQREGTYSKTFEGSDLPSGIYFYKLQTTSGSETKKMHLMKESPDLK